MLDVPTFKFEMLAHTHKPTSVSRHPRFSLEEDLLELFSYSFALADSN